MKSVNAISEKTISLLTDYSNPERKKLSDWYFPTSMKVYGLSSADLKPVVSEIKKEIQKPGSESLSKVATDLAENGIFECKEVAFGLINRHNNNIITDKIYII